MNSPVSPPQHTQPFFATRHLGEKERILTVSRLLVSVSSFKMWLFFVPPGKYRIFLRSTLMRDRNCQCLREGGCFVSKLARRPARLLRWKSRYLGGLEADCWRGKLRGDEKQVWSKYNYSNRHHGGRVEEWEGDCDILGAHGNMVMRLRLFLDESIGRIETREWLWLVAQPEKERANGKEIKRVRCFVSTAHGVGHDMGDGKGFMGEVGGKGKAA